ncbi:MAG: protein-L-isoaspartate(D-aspartate) O-methyltransferase [Synergistales bacterium]|nr:protein-L-isoaspartate(D-aspartate) O-methyltransferase [Synergistales bacterium]
MVERQLRPRGVRAEAVLEAMGRVPRHAFVPPSKEWAAYEDGPLSIGHGQTISQPYMVARMTELLQPGPGKRIFEIGTGSGYQAAVLAETGAEVVSMERYRVLADAARKRLDALGYQVTVVAGDARGGYAAMAPYDGIVVTAAAPTVEEAWIDQLADGGRLVVPLKQRVFGEQLLLKVKQGDALEESRLEYCSFVPLLPGVEEE